jgi:hypothetical protein
MALHNTGERKMKSFFLYGAKMIQGFLPQTLSKY